MALLEHGQPVLLCLDDLQWADRETLDWLHYLIRFETPTSLLVLTTLRTDDAAERERCQPLLRQLQRQDRLSEIDLTPLSINDTTALAQQILGDELYATYAAQLYHETDGNPFYIVETVRARPHSFLEPTDAARLPSYLESEVADQLPPRVRALIEERFARLSPLANEIMQLAAAIGRRFDFTLLIAVTRQDEDALVRGMEELWTQRIIREATPNSFDFVHDKLRVAAYTQIGPLRRPLYHRRIAEALANEQGAGRGSTDGQIASHFDRAGLRSQAISYYLSAAQAAKQLYANDDAFAFLERGIFLVERASEEESDMGSQMSALCDRLYTELGNMYMLVSNYDRPRHAYHTALAHLSHEEDLTRAVHLRRIGDTENAQHRYERALESYREAEGLFDAALNHALSSNTWQHEWVQLQLSLIALYYGTGDNAALTELIQTIRSRVMSHGSLIQKADFLEGVAMLNMRQERYAISEQTVESQHTALKAWRTAGDSTGIANNQFSLAFCLLWRRELDDAEENMSIARDLASKIGHGRVLTLCATYMAVAKRFRGEVEGTQRYALEGLRLSERYGIHFYTGMAKGNLAWVALRLGDDERAAALGQEASEIMTLAYPFRWAALWPLLGVSLDRNDLPTTVDYTRQLLDQRQQRLPVRVAQPLLDVLHAWEDSKDELTNRHLKRCVEAAIHLGYL